MKTLLNKIIAFAVLIPTFAVTGIGAVTPAIANADNTIKVTITKYIDGQPATAQTASSTSFLMSSSWNAANLGSGSGQYFLAANNPVPYQAETSIMDPGASYSTQELNPNGSPATTTCSSGQQYALVGYTSGNSMSQAVHATPSLTAPSFTNIRNDQYVIVWNRKCGSSLPPPSATSTVKVTIAKFIEGNHATATNASSTVFNMSATWNASNTGSGTGQYTLDPAGGYEAMTTNMTSGASYSTREIMPDGSNATTTCASGQRYVLTGYSTGNTLAAAMANPITTTAPSFTNLTSDKYVIVWNDDCTLPATPSTVKVRIAKYIQGAPATATSASSTVFNMSATWNASNTGSGTGQYTLDPAGGYEAMTTNMTSGASYSTREIMPDGSNATTTCASGQRYVLDGYTTGNSWTQALAASATTTAPSFTNLNQDKYVIVWNRDCTLPVPPATAKVHIVKYVDGVMANATTSNNLMFPMSATWKANNVNGGATSTGAFYLGNNHGGAADLYGAETTAMETPFYYTVSENTATSTSFLPNGSQCVEGKYRLDGYKTSSVSFAAAASSTLQTSAPVWNASNGHQYVIVYNTRCTAANSGTSTPLSVTVTPIKTSAIADNTYENGWKYMFHVTAPMNETNLSMKFSDWIGALGSSTIPVAGNMRISSAQSSTSPVTITAANTYSAPLQLNADLNSIAAGRQVEVLLEVKIPFGTVNTSYTTTFGLQTLP